MLNGLYPVIVIQKIKPQIRGSFSNGKITSTDLTPSLSKPIPVYLDESLTGIAIMSQSRRTEFVNDPIVSAENKEITVKQRGISNGVDIVLKASRNSIGMNLLLPLVDIAFQNANLGGYLISYFNQNIVLFRAKLANFSAEENNADTGVIINISLEREDKYEEEKKQAALPYDGNSSSPNFYKVG